MKSSTNSPTGSSHWFNTLVSRQKHIGEFLMSETPNEETLMAWAKELYDTSNELIEGFDSINK